jgi:hypothetical protein
VHAANERIVDERRERSDGFRGIQFKGRSGGLDGLPGASAHKDRQPAQQPLLDRVEQVVTPGDRVSHRLVTLGLIAASPNQQRKLMIQAGRQCRDRQHLQLRRRQLDRQGQPIETLADFHDTAAILLRHRKHGINSPGPLGKEPNRLDPGDRFQ